MTPAPTLWFHPASNTRVCLEAPTPDMIVLDDIFYSLAGQNRYNGHTRPRITVAEHSVRVAVLVRDVEELDPDLAPQCVAHALVHDFHETYTGDIVSPVIRLLARESAAYKELVARLDLVIWEKLAMAPPTPAQAAAVRKADMLALELERTACLGPSPSPPGDGWPVHDPALVRTAREAWANHTWTSPVRSGPSEFGWDAHTAEHALREMFASYFPF